MTRSLDALRRAMGASHPVTVTQQAFDHDRRHLKRLMAVRGEEPARPDDLWAYMQDLRFTAIDAELVKWLLPVCLQAWRADLHGARGYGGFVEHFWPALADRDILQAQLTSHQTQVVADFMRSGILDEMDRQRGLAWGGAHAAPYRWIRALASYGVLFPDVETLWKEWWLVRTVGHAVSSVQYVSSLLYADDANPVFAPWSAAHGGGAPVLWEYEGSLCAHCWLAANVEFLRRRLRSDAVTQVLQQASSRLANEPEAVLVARVLADLPSNSARLAARCAQLPDLLARCTQPVELLSWST